MLNFQRLFESIPGLYIIYDLDFAIVGGSDAFFQATLTKREEVVGRHLFEVFPDNPDDPNADGVRNLRASLESVLKYRKPHTMAVQKYDIRRPDSVGGGFEERYWTPVNTPFFDENGVMTHIIHRVEDVTEFMRVQQQRNEQRQLNQALECRTQQMEMEIYARAQELRAVNEQLQTANEALSKLDRAKTTFFSNVSHEFRTPLTLMLSPLEDTIAKLNGTIPPAELEQLQLVQRNGLRLLKLVNSLLDFSRIEAGRVQAAYEPVDLATYTAELASTFRSLVEQAGMTLLVDCPPLPEAIYVDRNMWEKIVLNLLSNAFKFTLMGTIAVRLHGFGDRVELSVADTGVGIPAEELPHLFERFHRVENSHCRSFEGSGIGLSLVQELVKLHAGTIAVSSTRGQGSCFTVTIPTGTAHLPLERISASRTSRSTAVGALPYIEEARRWLSDEESVEAWSREVDIIASPLNPTASPPHILLADDNADMRHYIQRLLSGTYTVQTVVDGVAALSAIAFHPPDLVLTDMMMPGMNGVELLRSLRSNPQTAAIPIILLSARAGVEARREGLTAGADDYLIKPFSARELQARVESTLKLSKLRREALQQEQMLRAASETAQQKAEAAFRRIDRLLESMSEAFIALDRDWRIIYQNATAERINNKPRSKVLGKTLWEEWPAAVGSISEQQYRHALAEQVAVHFEQHYYEPPDHNLWLEVHAYPFEEGLGIFYRDISDRKQAEELSRRTAELDAFRVSIADALRPLADPVEIQATASRVLGEYLDANRVAYFEVRGTDYVVERDYVNGAEALAGCYPIDSFGPKLLSAYRTGRAVSISDVETDPNLSPEQRSAYAAIQIGAYIGVPLSKEGEFVAGLAVHSSWARAWTPNEVSLAKEVAERTWAAVERARVEAALRQSEARFRTLISASSNVLYRMNADWSKMYELQGGDFIADTSEPIPNWMQKYIHPDDQARVLETIEVAIQNKRLFELEHRVRQVDGSLGWTYSRAVPLLDSVGEIIEWFGEASDISDRKRIEQEREQLLHHEQAAREAAESANRIKDEFLAVLSHELRSPLNPILGWSKLLQQGKLDATKTATALATIERNAQLQVQLIDDLLDISRILRGKLSLTVLPVDLSTVIWAALETVRLAAEAKNIQIQTTLAPGIGIVTGDAGRLQQVVWNLLSNAVKFTPANGQVTVALSSTDSHAQIQVTDTGKGIKPDFLPYVFEHFRQEDGATTRKFGGLGLGLAIVRQIVELHGGTVTVESSGEGAGATFTVRIPLASRFTLLPTSKQSFGSTGDLSGIRILVVDDEADSREFVAFVLEQAGAFVTTVASGMDALQAFPQAALDIIVSDIGMPEIDGYMLIRQIRALLNGQQIPAIALTAYAAEIDYQQAIAAGFGRHIKKPVEPDQLIEAIASLVSQRK